jgi:nicotinamide-nucleotide amidase
VPERPVCLLLSVGTELTEGTIQDAHLQFFGRELGRVGLELSVCVHTPDHREVFLRELERAASLAGVVIVTGGLGPTSDDLTRDVVAEAAGVELVYHPEIWAGLEQRFAGRRLVEANRRQCYLPAGFTILPNPHGTAPGFSGRIGGAMVFALPGPPRELQPMWRDAVLPVLASSWTLLEQEELRGVAHLIGESNLEDALSRCAVPGVSWGTRIADDRVAFVLRGGSAEARERFYASLRDLLGETHVRRGDRGAAQVLFDALAAAGARIATAESCTGGLVSAWLTDIPGSSAVFLGGVVAYADRSKAELLGVDTRAIEEHGAVSEEVVRQMAAGAARITGAEYGVAVSGVAGPGGGSPQKPVGTVWIAAVGPEGRSQAARFKFLGSRDAVRRRSASAACILAECLVAGRAWKLYEG